MDTKLVQAIRRTMDAKPNDELVQIYRQHNEEEWSAETFEVIRQILLARDATIPIIDFTTQNSATVGPETEKRVHDLVNWLRAKSTDELLKLYEEREHSLASFEAFRRLLTERNVPIP